MLGKSSSGKALLCSSTFSYLFILVIRIKMRVWVLFRLQIESPIRSEKDFTSANITTICSFISLNEMTLLWICEKFFFPNLELLNSGCGLSANAAYTPVFTVLPHFGRECTNCSCKTDCTCQFIVWLLEQDTLSFVPHSLGELLVYIQKLKDFILLRNNWKASLNVPCTENIADFKCTNQNVRTFYFHLKPLTPACFRMFCIN